MHICKAKNTGYKSGIYLTLKRLFSTMVVMYNGLPQLAQALSSTIIKSKQKVIGITWGNAENFGAYFLRSTHFLWW